MTLPSLIARLEEIEGRANAATPGPWKFNDNGVVTADAVGKIVCCFVMDFARIPDGEDWQFLEHARTDIPFLTTALRDALGREKALREVLEAIKRFGELANVSTEQGHVAPSGKKPGSKDVWQFPRHMLVEIDAALESRP